jgi:hypothetical protein
MGIKGVIHWFGKSNKIRNMGEGNTAINLMMNLKSFFFGDDNESEAKFVVSNE